MNNGLTLKQNLESLPKTGRGRKHQTIDLHTAGATALYNNSLSKLLGQSPTIRPLGGAGSFSGVFQKPDYLGGGIERYRQPEYDNRNGFHMNYETLIPGIKRPVINIHIPMNN